MYIQIDKDSNIDGLEQFAIHVKSGSLHQRQEQRRTESLSYATTT